jgi:hypothetical protein
VTSASIVLTPGHNGEPPAQSPNGDPDWQIDLAELLVDSAVPVVSPLVPRDTDEAADLDITRRAHWVAHCAVGIASARVPAPVLLVVCGETGCHVPALGFAQRAARRELAGYVLIDADVPPPGAAGGDWPDAPVTYVATPAADPECVTQARLRGWRIIEVAALEQVAQALLVAAEV